MSRGLLRKLLILGAFDPELEPLRALLDDSRHAAVSCHSIGIGIAEAAVHTTRLLLAEQITRVSLEEQPRHAVLFIGSAGVVHAQDGDSPCVNVLEAVMMDFARALEKAYVPKDSVTRIHADEERKNGISQALRASNCLVPEGVIYSPLSINSEHDSASACAKAAQAGYENLELFGVAVACRLLGVPWNALCPITNEVGPDGHRQWRERHRACADTVARLVVDYLLPDVYFPVLS